MPYRLTPTDIVTMLEESLQNIGTTADQDEAVLDIKKKLKLIKGYYPSLKILEIRIIEEFKKIGSSISRDDVLKKHDDAAAVKLRLQSINNILNQIKKITEENRISGEGIKVFTGQDSFSQRQSMESSSSYHSNFHLEMRLLESQVISSLEITFENLDHRSRLCSLCLSVFPEKIEIKKRPLIYWWIGEGFVRDTTDKVAEQIGDDIFNKLYRRGLIQPVYKDQNPIIDSCWIHPWMKKMLLKILIESQFSDFVNRVYYGDPTYQRRRAALIEADLATQVVKRDMEMLGTVFNVDKKHLQIESEVLSGLKRVKVLQLGRWQRQPEHHIELEIIGDTKKPRNDSQGTLLNLSTMKQLRYLSLQGISRVTELPDSINELSNLEILDLRACHNLEKLPSTIGMLRNLTHLDVTECYFLENMPKSIEKLSSLQVLKGFMIGTNHTSYCKIKDLSRVKKIRKLSIYIRNKGYDVQELGEFAGTESLRSLTITWGGGARIKQEKQPKSMDFPKLLEKLDLRCYPFRSANEWLNPEKLKKLKKLYIRGGSMESFYDPDLDEKYEELKILRMKYLKEMKNVIFVENEVPAVKIDEKVKEFPSLEYYEMARYKSMEGEELEIEEWTKVHGFRSFTRTKDQLV